MNEHRESAMSAPDTSPEAVERLIEKFDDFNESAAWVETRTLLRALSSQLQEAHRHLGTALGLIRDCAYLQPDSEVDHCIMCGHKRADHQNLAAARAYARAHGGQP